MDSVAADPLSAIRGRIDAIDEAMHQLLIERSGVVAELIRIKGTSKPASAFRPEREADMMRRLVMRHSGDLPLVTVEHIWREIITTFTAMQAPFGVAAGPAEDGLALRDVIRFYFGFAIPVTECPTTEAAIGRVERPGTDIAVIPATSPRRWWSELMGRESPKIFARLPFIELPGRPANLPAYVIGLPLQNAAAPDVRVLVLLDDSRSAEAVVSNGGRVIARAEGDLVAEVPASAELAQSAGHGVGAAQIIGGFAQPIQYVADRTA